MFALFVLSCKLKRCCDNGRCGVLDTLVALGECLACCLKKLRALLAFLLYHQRDEPTLNCVSLSLPCIKCTILASHPCSSIVSSVSCARLWTGPPGYPWACWIPSLMRTFKISNTLSRFSTVVTGVLFRIRLLAISPATALRVGYGWE